MSEVSRDLRLVEAMLFASPEPVTEAKLAARLDDEADLRALLADLKAQYSDRGINLVRVGNAWAFRTSPDLADALRIETVTTRKLSRAAIETLAIIAYHQPVTRAEIEEIRGVSHSKGSLDSLLEAGWIKPGRRRMTPGRPLTWITTPAFLDHFGLETVKDLPGLEDLRAAGLLDSRPAIQAFRGIVVGGEDEDGEAYDGDDGEGDESVEEDNEAYAAFADDGAGAEASDAEQVGSKQADEAAEVDAADDDAQQDGPSGDRKTETGAGSVVRQIR